MTLTTPLQAFLRAFAAKAWETETQLEAGGIDEAAAQRGLAASAAA